MTYIPLLELKLRIGSTSGNEYSAKRQLDSANGRRRGLLGVKLCASCDED